MCQHHRLRGTSDSYPRPVIVISCQDEKSQLKNRDKALRVLRSRLYDMELQKRHDEEAEARRSQVGTGDRSEKIRTYTFRRAV